MTELADLPFLIGGTGFLFQYDCCRAGKIPTVGGVINNIKLFEFGVEKRISWEEIT